MIQRFSIYKMICLAVLMTASISYASATPNISCPGNFSFTYTDQASLNESFADYLRAFRVSEDGCAITATTDFTTLTPPSFTGGCTTVVFEATDCEGTESCSATFIALGSGIQGATPICPGNMTLANCTSDEEAMASFTLWLEGFSFTGGCDVTTTDLSIYSPPGCGGTTEVLYEVTSMGVTIGCTAVFAIPAEVSAPDPAIPTMGQWGVICLFLVFMIIGILEVRTKSSLAH